MEIGKVSSYYNHVVVGGSTTQNCSQCGEEFRKQICDPQTICWSCLVESGNAKIPMFNKLIRKVN